MYLPGTRAIKAAQYRRLEALKQPGLGPSNGTPDQQQEAGRGSAGMTAGDVQDLASFK